MQFCTNLGSSVPSWLIGEYQMKKAATKLPDIVSTSSFFVWGHLSGLNWTALWSVSIEILHQDQPLSTVMSHHQPVSNHTQPLSNKNWPWATTIRPWWTPVNHHQTIMDLNITSTGPVYQTLTHYDGTGCTLIEPQWTIINHQQTATDHLPTIMQKLRKH